MTRIIRPFELIESDKILFDLKMKLYELNEKKGDIISRNGHLRTPSKKLKYIYDNYGKLPLAEISKNTGLAINTIQTYVSGTPLTCFYLKKDEIGFNKLINILTGRNSDIHLFKLVLTRYDFPVFKHDNSPYIVNLNEFYKWIKVHPRIIMLHNYEKGSLDGAPEWLDNKAAADKIAFQYIFKRKWTAAEDVKLTELVNNGAGYKECSVTLKRTGSAIKRRCYDLKIKKPKRNHWRYWSKAEQQQLKELWLKGYYPAAIMEMMNRSDREIISYLERFDYFGVKPEKFVLCGK